MEDYGVNEPKAVAYTRHEPWSLAPWLTGMIVAVVIFVVLIPAICSACFHYYYYKHGFEEGDLDGSDDEDDTDDDKDDDDDDIYSIDIEQELRKGKKKSKRFCSCFWSHPKKEEQLNKSIQVSDGSLISVDKINSKKCSNSMDYESSSRCPFHCKPDSEMSQRKLFFEKRRKVCNHNYIDTTNKEKVNGKPPISPDSFDEIVSIIEEGRKRRLLLEHKDVTASNGGQRTLPSLSCQAKRNNFKVKSLSMDAFSSEPHLHEQQQQGHQQLPDSWRGTLPVKRNQMMRKSRTELWSPPVPRLELVFKGYPSGSSPTSCGYCTVPQSSIDTPSCNEEPSPPQRPTSTSFWSPVEHNQNWSYDETKRHSTRSCYKHPSLPTPTPTPPPPPVSPDVTLLSFSPSCSQRCQKIMQKKSHTIWHPRSGATTVSYSKD